MSFSSRTTRIPSGGLFCSWTSSLLSLLKALLDIDCMNGWMDGFHRRHPVRRGAQSGPARHLLTMATISERVGCAGDAMDNAMAAVQEQSLSLLCRWVQVFGMDRRTDGAEGSKHRTDRRAGGYADATVHESDNGTTTGARQRNSCTPRLRDPCSGTLS